MMDTRQAARLLGGEVCGRDQIVCPGPGHSHRDRSLSVRFVASARDGFIVHSFSCDDPIVARDHVRDRLGLPRWEPGDEQDRRIPPSHRKEFDQMAIDREAEPRIRTEDDLLRINRARALWHEGIEPRGTVAEEYLRSRALDLPAELAGSVLRFHPRCPWRNENTGHVERIPALLAVFRSIDDDEITAVHRIRLNQPQRWPKAERKMLGLVHRAAVKLDRDATDTLVIGEGVETGMAAQQLGHRPMWALGSVGAISFFPVLEHVKTLIILGEAGKASADAIQFCGKRWSRTRRRVRIARPTIGSDLNDQLMQRA
jgi:putative DNA primase/helicase